MTELLYLEDSYLREFEAIITEIDEDSQAVALDKTAFYPGGGGQPYDTGKIVVNSLPINVSKVSKRQGKILHHLDVAETPPRPGTAIIGRLNWKRRYELMRTHTALHILCGVVFRDYGALVTGGDMSPLKGRMDFEFESMRKELINEIETAINIEVSRGRNVYAAVLPRAEAFKIPDLIRTKINLLPEGIEQVRTIEIEGLDLQADGGTHVRNTSEVGPIKIYDYKSKGKINKRIYIQLLN